MTAIVRVREPVLAQPDTSARAKSCGSNGRRSSMPSLESEAQLTILGRMIARRDLVRLLEGRLRHTELRKQHREIEFERIEKPLFILGMPRTGTSILHELWRRIRRTACRCRGR